MTRSATAHRPMPPPSAAPWTRAMTGTGQVSIVSNMSAIAIASCSLPSTSSAIAARIQSMSAPAQNDGPSPARTTARSSVGVLAGERRERRPQLGDQRRVERVVDVRSGERDPSDHAARSGPLDAECPIHRAIVAGGDPTLRCGRTPQYQTGASTFHPWAPRTRGLRTGARIRPGIASSRSGRVGEVPSGLACSCGRLHCSPP